MNYFSPICIAENSFENFDTDLQVFYHEVLSKELDLSKSPNVFGVRQALKDVVHAYKKDTVDANDSKILFDSPEKRCAYVLKHCPCFTSAVAKHFLQLVKRNSGLLDQALHHRKINLCCLGGGPGTEAVAILKIVNLVKNSILFRHRERIHVRVTIVDLSKEWKSTVELMLQTVQRNPTFCDSERIRLSFELINADLTEPLKEEVKIVLQEADIITMVYFVSAVNGSNAQNKCVSMQQNIMEKTKPGALLFFLDSAKTLHYISIMDSVNKFPNLKLNYGPFVQEFHTLSIKSIKKFMELYSNQFNTFMCLSNCFITCASWIKEVCSISDYRNFVAENRLTSNCSIFQIKENRKWNKRVEQNTRKQKKFRERLENLILLEMKMNFETDDMEERDDKFDMELYFCHKNTFYAGKCKRKRIILAAE